MICFNQIFWKQREVFPIFSQRFKNDMHWTNPIGLIWLFVCVYAEGHRLLNNIWERRDDYSPPSFFASGSGGESVCGLNTHVAAGLQSFALGTVSSLPLEIRIHSPSQAKMMCWLTFIYTFFFFLARMRGLYAQTQTWPPEWQNKGLGLSRLGWLREGHSLSLSLDVCPRGRPSDTSIVCVLVCLGSNNKISQMDCS